MIGFLTYLPTLVYSHHFIYVFIIIYLILSKGKNINFGSKNNLAILLTIILASIVNNFCHPENFVELKDYFPFIILILVSYLAACNFTRKDAKVIILFAVVESMFVLAESLSGVSTFFTGADLYTVFEDNSLLYFNRPLGISKNSSTAALKILAAILLLHYYNFKGKIFQFSLLFLFIGIALTFNRTVLVTLLFFYLIYFFHNINDFKIPKWMVGVFSICAGLVVVGLMVYSDKIIMEVVSQFTRNTGKIELTGRGEVWVLYWRFIENNFLFGNGSFKYLLTDFKPGRIFHGHNSFLQTLATHGVFIFSLYIILIFKNFNKKNYLYILTIMLYSVSQYGIFWGVSLLDIVFFVFLFKEKETISNKIK